MKISTITMVYNEEFLLPFFFKHYQFVDRMYFLYDMDSTDRTLALLRKEPKAYVIAHKFPDMMDDILKVARINELYAELTEDWVLNVDADEFAFIPLVDQAKEPPADILRIAFYNVYRHISEVNLNPEIPIYLQRCHGFLDPMYIKPVLVRAGLGAKWLPGNHVITNPGYRDLRISQDRFCRGAHWANADPCFAVERQVKNRRDRQSKFNLANHLTTQYHGITEEEVIKNLKDHENDPRLW